MSNTKVDEKIAAEMTNGSEAGNAPAAALGSPSPEKPGMLQASAEQVLLKYSHCSQCQARLHFSYLTDFSRNITQETARCPECHNQAHRVMHRLQ